MAQKLLRETLCYRCTFGKVQPMNIRFLAIATFAALASSAAQAAVVFDTVTGFTVIGSTGPTGVGGSTTLAGNSFTDSGDGSFAISLLLSASAPGDGGSATVYLVPDDGSGGSDGIAGLPTITSSPTYAFTSYAGAETIGTVADSSLTTTPALVTLTANAIPTADDEYWVVLDETGSTSILWSYELAGGGTGTSGQASFGNFAGGNLEPSGDGGGAYSMQVDAPEPASLGILGVGIAGLGYLRRRKAT